MHFDMRSFVQKPIFFHSLFRTSSTYFFHKFRSIGAEFTCYKEPLHENLILINKVKDSDGLIISPQGTAEHLRHPKMEKAYFHEYWVARHQLKGLFKKNFSYGRYFLEDECHIDPNLFLYLTGLLSCSQGRPVLHFCRSSGRVKAIKHSFEGLHYYLWRDPRIQWWSYKVSEYFDHANRRIFNSKHLPQSLKKIKDQIVQSCRQTRYYPARESYMMFYAIWLDAWIRCKESEIYFINVDTASLVQSENKRLSDTLSSQIGVALNFNDLCVSGMYFQPEENDFYEGIETYIHNIFLQTNQMSPLTVESAIQESRRARDLYRPEPISQRNLRQVSMGMMDRISKLKRPLFGF